MDEDSYEGNGNVSTNVRGALSTEGTGLAFAMPAAISTDGGRISSGVRLSPSLRTARPRRGELVITAKGIDMKKATSNGIAQGSVPAACQVRITTARRPSMTCGQSFLAASDHPTRWPTRCCASQEMRRPNARPAVKMATAKLAMGANTAANSNSMKLPVRTAREPPYNARRRSESRVSKTPNTLGIKLMPTTLTNSARPRVTG